MGLYDLKRSHYDCVCNLANEIATPRQVGARNDTPFCHCGRKGFLHASKLERSTKTEAGHDIQVVTAYPASLEMVIATGSHHSSVIST